MSQQPSLAVTVRVSHNFGRGGDLELGLAFLRLEFKGMVEWSRWKEMIPGLRLKGIDGSRD